MKILLTAAAVSTLGLFASSDEAAPRVRTAELPTIASVVIDDARFSTLEAALGAAGLVETFQGEGPFTVFAPTNAAFAALPEGTVESLLLPENVDTLTSILTYHVVAGAVASSDVVKLTGAQTLNGQRVDITVEKDRMGKITGVMADGANVIATDIQCANGVIHVLDAVILPATDDIVATAANAGSFQTLLAAAEAAGLVDLLTGEGPLTVFAPTDDAFAKLPAGTVESLLRPENLDDLRAILSLHVVRGQVYSDVVVGLESVKTLGGELPVKVSDAGVMIGGAKVVATDLDATNGVIHVIDSVILPRG